MRKTVAYILLIFCVIGFFAAGMILNPISRTVVMLAFFAGMISVFVVDGLLARRRQQEKMRMEGNRCEEVIRDIESTGTNFKVTASSGIWIGCFFLICGLLFCLPIDRGILIILVRAMCFLLAFHAFMIAVPRIGRPVLVLSIPGFETPEFGFIPWFEVDGVDLVALTSKGCVVGHYLVFHVPGLARYRHQFRSYQILLFPLRAKSCKEQLRVMLNGASDQPNVIRYVADELLKSSSGREYVWSSFVSEKENEAYGRLHELFKTDGGLLLRFKEAVRNKDGTAIEQLVRMAAKGDISIDQELQTIKAANEARQRRVSYALFALVMLTLIQLLLLPVLIVLRSK